MSIRSLSAAINSSFFSAISHQLSRTNHREFAVAEREGFEPPIRLPVCRISSAVHSTTLPPLQAGARGCRRYVAARGGPDKAGLQFAPEQTVDGVGPAAAQRDRKRQRPPHHDVFV